MEYEAKVAKFVCLFILCFWMGIGLFLAYYFANLCARKLTSNGFVAFEIPKFEE
jgi:hypothetical protein